MTKYYCYILKNSDNNRTYNGFTVNPKRRLRQHNQEIVGGAKYTKKHGNKNWEMYVLITGFPDEINALQAEWRIKHPDGRRKRPVKYSSPAGRIKGLSEVLRLKQWTKQSTILNDSLKLTVWIKREFEHLLTDLPTNIKIVPVDIINFEEIKTDDISNDNIKVDLIEPLTINEDRSTLA